MRYLLVVLLCFSATAFAKEYCPLPDGVKASFQASKELIDARNSGKNKAELMSFLEQQTYDESMHNLLKTMLNEVFSQPVLSPLVYSNYRAEICLASNKYEKEVRAIDFAEAYPLLKSCEKDARPNICAMKVVHKISGIPENLN